ncbi:Fic family protein [Bradyrhizobium sp. AZCC 1693]
MTTFTTSTSKRSRDRAAHFPAELNAIHAFREGNGRSQADVISGLIE